MGVDHDRLDHLLDTAPCGLVSFDDRGAISFVNAAFAEFIGLSEEELVGSNLMSLLSVGDRIFYQTHLFPMLRIHGRAEEIFLTFKSARGTDVPVLLNVVRNEEEDGWVNHAATMPVHRRGRYEAELVQARNRAEEALRTNAELTETQQILRSRTRELDRRLSRLSQRNEELKRLNRILSHDLREPVRKVETFTDILDLEDRGTLSADGAQAIDKIRESTARMNALLYALQEYLMVDVDTEPTFVSIGDIIRHAQEEAGVLSAGAHVAMRLQDCPQIEGFADQLQSLFVHLFDNALKFRKPDVPLELVVECTVIRDNMYRSVEGKYRYVDFARFTVADNGQGFAPRFCKYVFDILKKLDPHTPGVGMGLAICKKIVANHYGDISIQSEVGAGTRVVIVLPLNHDADDGDQGDDNRQDDDSRQSDDGDRGNEGDVNEPLDAPS